MWDGAGVRLAAVGFGMGAAVGVAEGARVGPAEGFGLESKVGALVGSGGDGGFGVRYMTVHKITTAAKSEPISTVITFFWRSLERHGLGPSSSLFC